MLPLSLLKTAVNHPMLVELKNGETYNGHLVQCDNWMNLQLRVSFGEDHFRQKSSFFLSEIWFDEETRFFRRAISNQFSPSGSHLYFTRWRSLLAHERVLCSRLDNKVLAYSRRGHRYGQRGKYSTHESSKGISDFSIEQYRLCTTECFILWLFKEPSFVVWKWSSFIVCWNCSFRTETATITVTVTVETTAVGAVATVTAVVVVVAIVAVAETTVVATKQLKLKNSLPCVLHLIICSPDPGNFLWNAR